MSVVFELFGATYGCHYSKENPLTLISFLEKVDGIVATLLGNKLSIFKFVRWHAWVHCGGRLLSDPVKRFHGT